MKKSLIAMALMFGAVVFVSSCGGGSSKDCAQCTITIVDYESTNAPTSSKYSNGEYCEGELEAIRAKNGQNVDADEALANKGGKYSVDCK